MAVPTVSKNVVNNGVCPFLLSFNVRKFSALVTFTKTPPNKLIFSQSVGKPLLIKTTVEA